MFCCNLFSSGFTCFITLPFLQVLLPHVVGGCLRAAMATKPTDPSAPGAQKELECDWATPERSPGSSRSLLAACKSFLTSAGFTKTQLKLVAFAIRTRLVCFAREDLASQRCLDDSDRTLLDLAAQQTARAAVKLHDSGTFNLAQLSAARTLVRGTPLLPSTLVLRCALSPLPHTLRAPQSACSLVWLLLFT